MALDSSSTLSDALAQYNDNLDWQGDTAKARLALEAIRFLLVNRPQKLSQTGRNSEYAALETEKKQLEDFLESADTTIRGNKCSFTRARMLT